MRIVFWLSWLRFITPKKIPMATVDVYKTPFFVAMLNGNTQGVALLRHWPMLKRKHWISRFFFAKDWKGTSSSISIFMFGFQAFVCTDCTIWNFGVLAKLHHVPKLNRGKRFFKKGICRKSETHDTHPVLCAPFSKRESENHHLHSGLLPVIV